jgi:hypothetical protein
MPGILQMIRHNELDKFRVVGRVVGWILAYPFVQDSVRGFVTEKANFVE